MFGFSFMNVEIVRYQIEHDRMFLSDYYVYFYHANSDYIFRVEASNVYKMCIMTSWTKCVLLGYTRKFMRNRFDVDFRDISESFMDNVRWIDL